jgi:hypothetical protein
LPLLILADEHDLSYTREKKNNIKKWFGRPEADSIEAGVVFCSFFLLTFMALLIFLYLMNTCILGMIKLMMLSFQRPGPSSR